MFSLISVIKVSQDNLFHWKKEFFLHQSNGSSFCFFCLRSSKRLQPPFYKLLVAKDTNPLSKVWQMNSHAMKYDTFQRAWKQLIDFQENAENWLNVA